MVKIVSMLHRGVSAALIGGAADEIPFWNKTLTVYTKYFDEETKTVGLVRSEKKGVSRRDVKKVQSDRDLQFS